MFLRARPPSSWGAMVGAKDRCRCARGGRPAARGGWAYAQPPALLLGETALAQQLHAQ